MPIARRILAAISVGFLPAWLSAQAPPSAAPSTSAAPNPFQLSPEERARLDQLAREDHADMMRQLGITKLRPGANGRAAAGEPGAPNYDPGQGQPLSGLAGRPDARRTAARSRPRSCGGRSGGRRSPSTSSARSTAACPTDVPKVTWTVAETVETTVGGQPVVARRVIGHVDNSAHPAISVDIKMAVVAARNAKGPVPVLMMFGWGNMPGEPLPRFPGAQEPAAPPSTEPAHRGRLGLRLAQHRQHPGRQRRRPHRGHHRAHQQGPAPDARAVGIAARVGLGRGPRARLPGDAARGRREARRHRRRVALRQGRARHHGFRAPLRDGPGGLVRRRRRQAAPPQLRRAGREPHGLRPVPLDGRQLPEVRRGRGVVRQQERRRHPGRRAPAHRAVRAAADVHQLRHPGEGRRELAGSAGQLHGHGGGRAGLPAARRARPRRDRGLPRGEDAARTTRACSTASSPGASTTAGTRTART